MDTNGDARNCERRKINSQRYRREREREKTTNGKSKKDRERERINGADWSHTKRLVVNAFVIRCKSWRFVVSPLTAPQKHESRRCTRQNTIIRPVNKFLRRALDEIELSDRFPGIAFWLRSKSLRRHVCVLLVHASPFEATERSKNQPRNILQISFTPKQRM